MKKIIAYILSAVCLAGSLTACQGAADNTAEKHPDKIVIGTQSFIHDQSLAIAKGYLEEALGDDIDIEVVVFSSGRDAIQAMTAGDIDIAHSGCIPAVAGIANGLDAKVIWLHNLLNVSDAVVAREGTGIASLKDLAGKRVATTFASTAHYALERGLAAAGMDPYDVEMLDMQPEEIFAAWSRGDIDVAATWDPVLSSLDGGEIIYTAGDSAADGYPIFDFGLVSDDFAKTYPNLVVKYVQALEKAEQQKKNDLDDTIATLADYLELSIEDTTTQIAGSIWLIGEEQLAEQYLGGDMANNLYQMAQYLYDSGNLAEMPEKELFENAVDASYIKDALGK